MSKVLGIDPGVTGGFAFVDTERRLQGAEDIPTAGGEVDVDALVRRIERMKPDVAVIERASSRSGQGVASSFKYGTAYGALRALVTLCRIPCHLVTPQKWKKQFRLDKDKEKARALAIRLWPGHGLFERKMDHGRAEAALIALYGVEVILQGRTRPMVVRRGTKATGRAKAPARGRVADETRGRAARRGNTDTFR